MSFIPEVGFRTKRYEYFVSKSEVLSNIDLAQGGDDDDSGSFDQSIHLSDLLNETSLQDILRNDDLVEFDSFNHYINELRQLPEHELSIDDFPAANGIIEESNNRYRTCAKIFVLNESFTGFIRVFEYYVKNIDDIERFVALKENEEKQAYMAVLALEQTLKADVLDLPQHDARDAAYWLYRLIKDE